MLELIIVQYHAQYIILYWIGNQIGDSAVTVDFLKSK